MNFFSQEKIRVLHPELKQTLADVRKRRNFDATAYIQQKASKLNEYMREYGLKSCVVAISGGIDSAVTYAIVSQAQKESDSPIQKIVPVFIPVYQSEGATNQESARAKAEELVLSFGNEKLIEIDISDAHQILKGDVDKALGVHGEAWASGQLVSYLRTPTYYYLTSLLSQMGLKPIICGTTNRDEGAYLGYFGKASDGMVDVQMISDVHKSEIYQVASQLGVPVSIIQAVPTGDMYDNRSDEEVFGSPYDFVELYMDFLNHSDAEKELLTKKFSEEAKDQFLILQKNLEELHRYNKHKYLGASPAVHLDVIEGEVRGGWMYNNYEGV